MKHTILISLSLILTYTFSYAQKNEKKNNFHTFLGVDVDNNSLKTKGLYVNGVYKGFDAEKAGIKRGDSLMAINAIPVNSFDELVRTLDKFNAGDKIELLIVRNNQLQKISSGVSAYPEFLKYNSGVWMKEMSEKGFEGEIRRAKLGVDVDPVWDKYAVKVSEVIDNSGAAKAGIQPGDIILKMDHYEFATIEELKYYLSKYNPGDIATLSVLHNGEIRSLKVSLGEEIIHVESKKEKETNKHKDKEKKHSDNK